MKRTESIHIGGRVFTIDEDAYAALNTYLESIKQYFSAHGEEDVAEITSDIEARIAELIEAQSHDAAVTKKVVDAVIKEIGTVKDIAGDDTDTGEAATRQSEKRSSDWQPGKKLYRDTENRVLGGVAAGLAAFTGIDVTIVRILFVVLVLLWGSGVWIYIILWLIVPEAKSTAEKMAMKGRRMTLADIEEAMNRGIDATLTDENKQKARSFGRTILDGLNQFFLAIGTIIKNIIPALSVLVGIAVLIGAVAATFAATIFLPIILFNSDPEFVDVAFRDLLPNTPAASAFLILLTITIILAVVSLFMIALSFIRRKVVFGKNTFAAVILGTVILAGVATSFGIQLSPHIASAVESVENQTQTTETVTDLDSFSAIRAQNSFNITLQHGETRSVDVTANERQLKHIDVHVQGDMLVLEQNEPWRICFFTCLFQNIDITITTPGPIVYIDISGATTFTALDATNFAEALHVKMSGASDARIETNANVSIEASGASDLTLSGTGETLDVELSGASELSALRYIVSIADVHLSGASEVVVNATEKLIMDASGASTVKFVGAPVIEQSLSGASEMHRVDGPNPSLLETEDSEAEIEATNDEQQDQELL